MAAATLAGLTALAFAQASGPDYFRITGLKKEDNVNVRREPNSDSKLVGRIPKDADGIKNLGCKGGLSQKQWEKASEAKKKAAARERWCQVSYKNVKGWVIGRFLEEGTAPDDQAPSAPSTTEQKMRPQTPMASLPMQTTLPTIDCDKADKHAEKLICADNGLKALDREIARLYAKASDALNATPGYEELLDTQRKWLGQRNTCFDRDCLAEMSALRIHQIRKNFSESRADDARGVSLGPVLVRCEGFPLPITATFVNVDPGLVYLEWLGSSVTMPQVPSGSGARYEGNFASMHTKGSEALLRLPGGRMDMNCKMERAS